ncbi:hypothetical protein K432DRAFT_142842 [Lepidopterella palustris CBS 459.81]|uniref:F-box domain-containing protein n=1 Tax=Lepidopterella palustris CBS 459.81 TaxID=1314670 RepID=A0A8E2JBP9_9PEZI|nr:hypothetical protein K432DRAFT_142842 [Lepidopterella palustris CBS 459.81]
MSYDRSNLLFLPAELRLEVYSYYFTHDPTLPTPPLPNSPLALSLTCKQLYHETHEQAFAATTFRTRAWHFVDVERRLRRVRPSYRRNITRIEVIADLTEFLWDSQSLRGFWFADAGLKGLEEIYIRFSGRHVSDLREGMVLSNLEVLLWKTVVLCGNVKLKKVRIVHDGLFGGLDIWEIYGRIQQSWQVKLSQEVGGHKWSFVEDKEEGRFRLVREGKDGEAERQVVVLYGNDARDAEMYREVQKELNEVIDDVMQHATGEGPQPFSTICEPWTLIP